MMWLVWLACSVDKEPEPAPFQTELRADDDGPLLPLAAPRLARRISLDLRGVLPTVAELNAVEADPAALDALVDQWLADPRLEGRMVSLLSERWHTKVDEFLMFYWEYRELAGDDLQEYPFESAIGEEPLRLLAHVIATDQPWGEVVRADWTMANPLLASIWPIERPAGEGWLVSRYTDGRPAAGVLATNGLWWRYYTTHSNLNRARAAAISRLLICEDYLARPVAFSSDLALEDSTGINQALRTNPYCQGCHSSMDPMAAALFGFWPAGEHATQEMDHYHPEREQLSVWLAGAEPAWFGKPVSGLEELGGAIAEDPRFARCAAESFASLLWRRDVVVGDVQRVEALRQAYMAGDQKIKPLLKAITQTPVYRAGSLSAEASPAQQDAEATERLLGASLLSSSIEDLTGFVWVEEGFPQLDNDTWGFRILGGGVDGAYVTRPQATPGATWVLVTQRLAEAAAATAVPAHFAGGDNRLLELAPGVPSTDPAFAAELDRLHWRLYGQRPDATWQAAIRGLYDGVFVAEGEQAAWQAVLIAMFRDPLFVSY